MSRREIIGRHQFSGGYNDSRSPLGAPMNENAEGSFGSLYLAENVIRPFKGFYTQGAGTGSKVMVPLGNTFGGLRNYSTVTGMGNALLDFSKTLYYIGAGEVTIEGIPVDVESVAFTFVAGDVNTGTGVVTVANTLTTGQPVYVTSTLTVPLGLTSAGAYFAIAGGGTTFKLASTYKNALAGTPITGGTAGSGTMSLHSGSGAPLRASTVLQVASNQVASYFYDYNDSAGLGIVDTPLVTVPTAPSANYTGFVNGAVNFRIAAIRDRQNVGVDIDTPDAPVKGIASAATAVVVPVNNTIQITFPTAISGQTHWAVFSTDQGFGGTGDFNRLGYRTSSDADATWYYGISETTVAAATGRVLEFDYRTGDLLPELAWIQDYAPEPGTNAVRLENIMVVAGVFDGSVAQVSLPNFYESYNPFHLLYFPEPVTAVLSRQIDNYAFVACRNSIHTVSYVGYRGDDLPSATISTVTPEVGIAYQQNWCQGGGNIGMWIDGTGIALMHNDGTLDLEFGKEVSRFTETWTAVNVVASFDPSTRSFVFAHQGQSVSYSLQSGEWSCPVYLTDYGFASTVTWSSAISSQGRMYVSLDDNAGAVTAYKYDDNTSTTRAPICSIGNWINTESPARGNGIYEAEATIRAFAGMTEPVVICISKNLVQPYIRGVSVTSSSPNITVTSGTFPSSGTTGAYGAVFGTNIGGSGINYLVVKLTYVSSSVVSMSDPLTGSAVNASASASNCFMLYGAYAYALTPTVTTNSLNQHLPSIRPAIQDARTFCTSVWMATNAATGAVWQVDMFGRAHATSAVGVGVV